MKLPTLCFVSAAALLLPGILQARTWKEAGSDRSFEGEFVKADSDQVEIRRPSGTVKVPLARLSDEDKKFVADATAPKEAPAAEFKWETNLEVAKKRAKDEKKVILADFTGSDWCGWCMKLKAEVFDQPSFQAYAKEHLVMLELDFPKQKELPKEEKEQNEKLQQEFKIQGFPTVILLNAKGKEVARTGYEAGGPDKYVESLKGLIKGKKNKEQE